MTNIGILGGGQLAMMMTESAIKMGLNVYVLEPTKDCPATKVGATQMSGSFKNRTDIYTFIEKYNINVLTYDIESVDAETLIEIQDKSNINIEIHPNPKILRVIQNKWTQKEFYVKNSLPTPNYYPVDIWRPKYENGIVLKTKYGGYDGKGVWCMNSSEEFSSIITNSGFPLSQFYF